MFLVFRSNLKFEGLDFIECILYVLEVVVHLDILEESESEVLVC